MIKTEMIRDALTCDDRLDDKINVFIEKNRRHIKVIDIKFTSVNNRATALIIYEEYD